MIRICRISTPNRWIDLILSRDVGNVLVKQSVLAKGLTELSCADAGRSFPTHIDEYSTPRIHDKSVAIRLALVVMPTDLCCQ